MGLLMIILGDEVTAVWRGETQNFETIKMVKYLQKKINAILISTKIKLQKLTSTQKYKSATNWQNFTEIK